MRFLRRLAFWLRFRARQAQLRDEIAFHRDLVAADLERRGAAPADARDGARRIVGNETAAREEARAVWLAPALDAIQQDWRYAWRGLRRSRTFTVVAVTSLALGIGANTAIFSLLYGLLFARVPGPSANQLVQLRRELGPKGVDERFSRAEIAALAAGPTPLSSFASTLASIEVGGVAATVSTDAVDGRYFEILALQPERGRLIAPGDDAAATPIVVVSDRFWRGRLDADSAVVGRTIKIADQAFTIIGVTPPGFAGIRFPAIADVFIPFRAATAFGIYRGVDDRSQAVTAFGRRAEAQSVPVVESRLSPIWNRCCATGALVSPQRGASETRATLRVVDASRGIPQVKLDLRGQYRRILLALMAGVGVLLLAACANVANLLLARSAARAGELAMRLALGASRGRLVAQLVIESLQLSLLGAIAGVLLARLATPLLTRERIGDLSSVVHPSLGSTVLVFTAVVSVVSGIVFGVVPALRVMRVDLATPLKQAGRRTAGRRGLFDRGLVALQVALAVLLVSGATLLVETLRNLRETDLGFDPSQRMVVSVETRRTAYQRGGMTARMVDEMLRRTRGIPGVRAAAFSSLLPVFGGRTTFDDVTVRGGQPPADGDRSTLFVGVTPGYFDALGIPLRAGRDVPPPMATASLRSVRGVVVNELFAKKFFPGRDVIGQTFDDGSEGDTVLQANRIVGVVGSSKFIGPRTPAKPMYFVPIEDGDWPYLMLTVHTGTDGPSIGASVGRIVADVAPGIGRDEPRRLSASIDEALARERVSAALATLFGIIALSLVAVGLYGVMLYHVTERTTEIGIRVALGARSSALVGMVARQSLGIVAVGLAAGLPMALFTGRAVSSQLYGVEPYSASALAVAAIGIMTIALVACLVPMRRAVAIDPLTALRET